MVSIPMMVRIISSIIITGPIGIPISTTIAYTPPHRIPSAIVIRTIPGVPVPWITMPWIVNIRDAVPVPWIVMVTSMEACQAETIIKVYIIAIGETLFIPLTISQVVKTLGRETIGLGFTRIFSLHFHRKSVSRLWRRTSATSVVFINVTTLCN
jgi:hypothetical protein